MTRILAADIGGTKTLLQLGEERGKRFRVINEQRFASQDYATFDAVLREFLDACDRPPIDSGCLAIAGPVSADGANANVTNLPWMLDRRRLQRDFDIDRLSLVNDFHAVAAGIETLRGDDVMTLQAGQPQRYGAQLVVGAGTGLGVAQRFWCGDAYQVQDAEAGHAGFAPATDQQRQLLAFLAKDHASVSREHVLSGPGMVTIYRFLCQQNRQMCQTLIDPAQISAVATQAAADEHQVCRDTLALFFEIFGSECGNLALTTLPYGGVYIAGGIVAKNSDAIRASAFVEAFRHKSKMSGLLAAIPIHVIRNEAVGLNGARWIAGRAA